MKKRFISLLITISLFSAGLFAESTYTVEKGETLYSISRKFQITVAELRAANNIKESDVLKAGQKLTIPEADIGTAAALSTTKNSTGKITPSKSTTYTVQKGDTLYRIAKNNSMTVAELMAMNGLNSNSVIKAGQKLKINKKGTTTAEVAVKPAPAKPVNTGNSSTIDETIISITDKVPDTRTYGNTVNADNSTKWPVANPKVTTVKGKVSGVQLNAKVNEAVKCIHEGTVMYVGTYRGFGQVVFVQTKTGLIYAYTGLGSVNVKKGAYLVGDSVIGTAGVDSLTGNSQITFMVFQNGQPIDPAKAPRS